MDEFITLQRFEEKIAQLEAEIARNREIAQAAAIVTETETTAIPRIEEPQREKTLEELVAERKEMPLWQRDELDRIERQKHLERMRRVQQAANEKQKSDLAAYREWRKEHADELGRSPQERNEIKDR